MYTRCNDNSVITTFKKTLQHCNAHALQRHVNVVMANKHALQRCYNVLNHCDLCARDAIYMREIDILDCTRLQIVRDYRYNNKYTLAFRVQLTAEQRPLLSMLCHRVRSWLKPDPRRVNGLQECASVRSWLKPDFARRERHTAGGSAPLAAHEHR